MTDASSGKRAAALVATTAVVSAAGAAAVGWAAATPATTTTTATTAPVDATPAVDAAGVAALNRQLRTAHLGLLGVRRELVRLSRMAAALPRAHAGTTQPAASTPAYVPPAFPAAPAYVPPAAAPVAPAAPPPAHTTTGASGATRP